MKNIPTVFVIFGATGDLMEKKIVPALFHLFKKNKLPKLFRVVGFSRRSLSDESFKTFISEILKKHKNHPLREDKEFIQFVDKFFYQQGNFEEIDSYKLLSRDLGRVDGEWNVCSNKLFYLAVPPKYYEGIFNNLSSSGLTLPCSPEEGWTRIIVEKPFGHDLITAQRLDLLLGKLFKEEQIYRIDHYLAKEMLQNILSFRFANNLFEEGWNNKTIEKVEIRLLEKTGVEGRGAFYDGLGALRDVGQNHLLQMLALLMMDRPADFEADSVRSKRAEILQTLQTPTLDEIKTNTYRAQYIGYKKIEDVSSSSKTETYFKVKVNLTSAKWQGVAIFIESGKKMKDQIKEVVVTFRHISPCLCPPGNHHQNKIIIRLEPNEEIQIRFLSKKIGLAMEVEERSFDFMFRKMGEKRQYVEEYEKLLLDCIEGNQLLFVSTQEIASMWRFIDPIVCAWDENKVPLQFYKSDTDEVLLDSKGFFQNEKEKSAIKKEVGIIGLGKIGKNIAKQLMGGDWRVVTYNRTAAVTKNLESDGAIGAYSLKELVMKLKRPRVVWLSLPTGQPLDEVLFGEVGLIHFLDKGDIVIEAGNSNYGDSIKRAKMLKNKGVEFVDVGVSGGPGGARYGASLMVGGDRRIYDYLFPLFLEIAAPGGIQFFQGAGAGHFVKMVHNGIEYGMMQSIVEGFTVLKKSKYKLDLKKIADVYNHGSVIESKLIEWLKDAFEIYGEELKEISGKVAHTGEGAWTIQEAEKLKIKTKVIKDALKFRIDSQKNPSYTGKILTALRNQFGGHSIK